VAMDMEKSCTRQTRSAHRSEVTGKSAVVVSVAFHDPFARFSDRTSSARFIPFVPVGRGDVGRVTSLGRAVRRTTANQGDLLGQVIALSVHGRTVMNGGVRGIFAG